MANILLENVTIDIPVFTAENRSLRKSLLRFGGGEGRLKQQSGHVVARALNKINLHLKDGDRVGLVGVNGAGKTTLLRVLAGTYPPVSGRIRAEGRIASLLDVSLGLDYELSGLQNIYLKGMFHGLNRRDIDGGLAEVIDFADLGEFINLPVRTYSSGMVLRLAFSIITSLAPDIILMDEWVSVGDSHFIERATQRLESFVGKSSILVLASHSEELIRKVCNRAVLMSQGNILNDGSVADVFHQYHVMGPQPFFNAKEYLALNDDVEAAVERGQLSAWDHFLLYGIREPRLVGRGLDLAFFAKDAIFQDALAANDVSAAAKRLIAVAPFLEPVTLPENWRMSKSTPIPLDFVPPEGVFLRLPPGVEVPEGVEVPAYFKS
jgi:lipopolysaccharide transport system ATP-binding protein